MGVFANFTPVWGALGLTVLNALGITRIKQSARISGDAAMAVFFSFGLALGIVLISLSPTFAVNLSSLLFGSILLITWSDVGLVLAVSVVSVSIMLLLFKEFFYIALDEELARSSGLPVNMLNYLLSILIGIIVVAGMRIVGILLISALLAIPALASMQLSSSFKQTVLLSVLFGLASVLIGLLAALEWNVAPGGAIVLTSVAIFIASVAVRRSRERRDVLGGTIPRHLTTSEVKDSV